MLNWQFKRRKGSHVVYFGLYWLLVLTSRAETGRGRPSVGTVRSWLALGDGPTLFYVIGLLTSKSMLSECLNS